MAAVLRAAAVYLCLAPILVYAGSGVSREQAEMRKISPFGVLDFLHWNHSWNNYQYPDTKSIERSLALMKQAGIKWVRLDFLWQEIEPREGEFVFTKHDALAALIRKYDLNILGILGYSADWASSCGKWNCVPRDNRLFAAYATAVVKRYSGAVKYWEIWNEPDSSVYFKPQDMLTTYVALLKDTYRAIKQADPRAQVLNGGFAEGILSVNRLYDNGGKDYFDILNLHIFEFPMREAAIKAVASYPRLARKIMDRNGDTAKKIWITEIGCPGIKGGLKVKNWWAGVNPSEEKQAQWLTQAYEALLDDASVEVIFWAFFRDTKDHWKDGTDYFGLIRNDFTLKPAFKAYQKLIR